MSALSNLLGKVRRLPEAAVELWSRFWEADRKTLLDDRLSEQQQLRDLIAKLQTKDLVLSNEIRQLKGRRYLGIGS